MFLAVRDLWWARSRFALMVVAVAMITALVVLLSGLTEGLGRQSISAITSLKTDRIVFEQPPSGQELSMNAGMVTAAQVAKARTQPGVRSADALGIATGRVTTQDGSAQVALFGIDPGAAAAPRGLTASSAVVSTELAADRGLTVGDTITVGTTRMEVGAVVEDASFSHQPVVWVPRSVWAQHASDARAAGSVILLDTGPGFAPAAFDQATGMVSKTTSESLGTIGAYTSENGSLTLIRGLLIAISALVIGAFFTVWTVQREGDLAVLKAIGARTSYLVRDSVGQAFLTLLIGGTIGALLAIVGGWAASSRVPMVIDAATVVPSLLLILLVGLVGATLALRRVVTVDPLEALAGAR
ncbi:ABC transporter permease [Yimella sp. cx-573]|nr:ABC transporter permease [Yimella sp. cx-573]